MKFAIYVTYIFSAFFIRDIRGIILENISVPSMVLIEDADMKPIILDCQYTLKDDTKVLVVKWLKDNQAIYQWIRGQKPSVFPHFKDQVDSTYKISSDPDHQFRALALINPTNEMSGVYKCVVQTHKSTHAMEKKLQVIDVRNYTLNLNHHTTQNETHLECTVDNVYPEPTMHLTADDDDTISIVSFKVNEYENGYFNATTVAVVNDDDVDADSYRCTVTFLGLPLNLTAAATSGSYIKILANWLLPVVILIAVA